MHIIAIQNQMKPATEHMIQLSFPPCTHNSKDKVSVKDTTIKWDCKWGGGTHFTLNQVRLIKKQKILKKQGKILAAQGEKVETSELTVYSMSV